MALDPVSCTASNKSQAKADSQLSPKPALGACSPMHEDVELTNVNSSFCGPMLPGPGPAHAQLVNAH